MYRFFSTHYIPLTTPTLYIADVWVTLSYLLVLRSNDISVDWFCGSGVLGMGTAGATPKLFLLNWMANPPIGCIARLVSVRSMYGWPCRLENVPKRQKTSNSKTHFMPRVSFCTPWYYQTNSGFVMFSRCIERWASWKSWNGLKGRVRESVPKIHFLLTWLLARSIF